jgi:hypothetical protein
VATATNVVKIPNGALRYKPDLNAEEIRALYLRHGIPEGTGERLSSTKTQTTASGAGTPSGGRPPSGQAAPVPPKYDTQVVWRLAPDKSLEPVRIKTGITDHTFTEMVQALNGDLKPGDELVTGVAQGRTSSGAQRPGSPAAPRGR